MRQKARALFVLVNGKFFSYVLLFLQTHVLLCIIKIRNMTFCELTGIHLHKKRKECFDMMYPYMTLSDETEIVHSQLIEDKGIKRSL